MKQLKIVKIGGNIIDNPSYLTQILKDFAAVEGPKILIHGGGILASEFNKKLNIKTKMHEGRRITDEKNLETVIMIYAGLINKNIVATLQSYQCNAIGLTGADANLITSKKRSSSPIDYGFVGDIEEVNTSTIALLLENNITPAFCAITHNQKGQLLNTNADTIAAKIAIAMSKNYETELIYCFEKEGVLANIDNPNSLIPSINKTSYEDLKKRNIIHSGMLPKLENCFNALNQNVKKVIISNYKVLGKQDCKHTSITL